MKAHYSENFVSITREEIDLEKLTVSTLQVSGINALTFFLKCRSKGGGDNNKEFTIPKHILVVSTRNKVISDKKFTFRRNLVDDRIKKHHKVIFFVEIIDNYIEWNQKRDNVIQGSDAINRMYEQIYTSSIGHSNIRFYFRGGITAKKYYDITNNLFGDYEIPHYMLNFDLINEKEFNDKHEDEDTCIRFYRKTTCFGFLSGEEERIMKARQSLLEEVHRLTKGGTLFDPDDLIIESFQLQGSTSYDREKIETISFFVLKYFLYMQRENKDAIQWFIDTELTLFKARLKKLFKKREDEVAIVTGVLFTDLIRRGEIEFGVIESLTLDLLSSIRRCIGTVSVNGVTKKCKYFFACKASLLLNLSGMNMHHICIKNGYCYFNYFTLYDFMIGYYKRVIETDLLNRIEMEKILSLWSMTRLRPVSMAKPFIKRTLKHATMMHIGLVTTGFKASTPVQRSIPDIEVCYDKKFLPLCADIILWRLFEKDPHHLHHGERFFLINFLFEIGYSYLDIKEFLFKKDTKANTYVEEMNPMVKKRGENRFILPNTNFFYKQNLTYACAFYASDNYKQDGPVVQNPSSKKKYKSSHVVTEDEYTGCPFHYLRGNLPELKKHLERYGVKDTKLGETKVIQILDAVKNEEPKAACLITFESRHGKMAQTTAPNRPSRYVDMALVFNQEREFGIKTSNITLKKDVNSN
jgi:hypothetical protein